MRGTFTHQNPDFLKDVQEMLNLGFRELSMEPVVCAPGDASGLNEKDMEIGISPHMIKVAAYKGKHYPMGQCKLEVLD